MSGHRESNPGLSMQAVAARRADRLLSGFSDATDGPHGSARGSHASGANKPSSSSSSSPTLATAMAARDSARQQADAASQQLRQLVAERFRALVRSADSVTAMGQSAAGIAELSKSSQRTAHMMLRDTLPVRGNNNNGNSKAALLASSFAPGVAMEISSATSSTAGEFMQANRIAELLGVLVATPELIWSALDDAHVPDFASAAATGAVPAVAKLVPPADVLVTHFVQDTPAQKLRSGALLRGTTQLAASSNALRSLRNIRRQAADQGRLENVFPIVNRLNASLRIFPGKLVHAAKNDFLEALYLTTAHLEFISSALTGQQPSVASQQGSQSVTSAQSSAEVFIASGAVGSALCAAVKCANWKQTSALSLAKVLRSDFLSARKRTLVRLLSLEKKEGVSDFAHALMLTSCSITLIQQTIVMAFHLFASGPSQTPSLLWRMFSNFASFFEVDVSFDSQFLEDEHVVSDLSAFLQNISKDVFGLASGSEGDQQVPLFDRVVSKVRDAGELNLLFHSLAFFSRASLVPSSHFGARTRGRIGAFEQHMNLFNALFQPALQRCLKNHLRASVHSLVTLSEPLIASLRSLSGASNLSQNDEIRGAELARVAQELVGHVEQKLQQLLGSIRKLCPSSDQAAGPLNPISSLARAALRPSVEDEIVLLLNEHIVKELLQSIRSVVSRRQRRAAFDGAVRPSLSAMDRDIVRCLGNIAQSLRNSAALRDLLNDAGDQTQKGSSQQTMRYAGAVAALRRCQQVSVAHWALSQASDFGQESRTLFKDSLSMATLGKSKESDAGKGGGDDPESCPTHPSPALLKLLFDLSGLASSEIGVGADHTSSLLFLAGCCAASAYDAVHSAIGSLAAEGDTVSFHTLSIVQLVFDLKFLSTVLGLPPPHALSAQAQRDLVTMSEAIEGSDARESSASTPRPTPIDAIALGARATTLASSLEGRLDPIDVAFYKPQLAKVVDIAYERTRLLLGGLTSVTGTSRPAATPSPSSAGGATSSHNAMLLAPTVGRFHLLPVSAPLVLAHSTRKQQQETAVEMLSGLAAEASPAPTSRTASSQTAPVATADGSSSRFGLGRLGSMFAGGGAPAATTTAPATSTNTSSTDRPRGRPGTAASSSDMLFM